MTSSQPGSTSESPTENDVAVYERLFPMLQAAHREMSELSKKKQDGIVNSLKIRNINRLLENLKVIIEKDPSKDYVELLDEEELPQNSDAVLLLSQWQAALQQYKRHHFGRESSHTPERWFTAEKPRTSPDSMY